MDPNGSRPALVPTADAVRIRMNSLLDLAAGSHSQCFQPGGSTHYSLKLAPMLRRIDNDIDTTPPLLACELTFDGVPFSQRDGDELPHRAFPGTHPVKPILRRAHEKVLGGVQTLPPTPPRYPVHTPPPHLSYGAGP